MAKDQVKVAKDWVNDPSRTVPQLVEGAKQLSVSYSGKNKPALQKDMTGALKGADGDVSGLDTKKAQRDAAKKSGASTTGKTGTKTGTKSKTGAKSTTKRAEEEKPMRTVDLALYKTIAALIGDILLATVAQISLAYRWFNTFSEKPIATPAVLSDARQQAQDILMDLSVRGVTHSGILLETWDKLATPAAPPAKPNSITAPAKTEGNQTVGLTWTPSSTPGAQTRIRRTIEGETEEDLGTTTRNVFAETALTNGKKVTYKLTAEVNGVESDPPVVVEATPKAADAPKPPPQFSNFFERVTREPRTRSLSIMVVGIALFGFFLIVMREPALVLVGAVVFLVGMGLYPQTPKPPTTTGGTTS